MILPDISDYNEFNTHYRLQPDSWKEAAEAIGAKHGITIYDFKAYPEGSNLVASLNDDLIIKIFPPFHIHQWESEYNVLGFLQNKLTISLPALIAYGMINNNWTYIIITKLPGLQLENVWSKCAFENKISILSKIGAVMKEVHSLETNELSEIEPEWHNFFKHQLIKCKERHRKNGMPDWFLTQVEHYVTTYIYLLPKYPKLVILTGEYTPFNLLVQLSHDNWEITGMIDFGDAMIGYREYDLLGPLLFLCEGKTILIQTLFEAYGYRKEEMNMKLRRRLLLLAILHRYSNLKEQIRISGWQDNVSNFDELEQIIWPI